MITKMEQNKIAGLFLSYFPELTGLQLQQLAMLYELYADWNAKINVISRKDIDNLYVHHVLHSMGIGKILHFKAGTRLLDVGTGGGFPGIPLAILFPECSFKLIDAIGKKIRVAVAVAEAIGLRNLMAMHQRVQDEKEQYDFVVSRAVMPLPELAGLVRKNIAKEQHNALPNGLICLKGGELQAELQPYRHIVSTYNLSDYFEEEFFATKKVVYLPM